jgi:hypothetical protein
MYSKT